MTEDKYCGRFRLRLYSIFVPGNSPFYTLWMSIYPNVTEEGLINFPKVAE